MSSEAVVARHEALRGLAESLGAQKHQLKSPFISAEQGVSNATVPSGSSSCAQHRRRTFFIFAVPVFVYRVRYERQIPVAPLMERNRPTRLLFYTRIVAADHMGCSHWPGAQLTIWTGRFVS